MVYNNCALYMLLYKQCRGFYCCSKRVVNARSQTKYLTTKISRSTVISNSHRHNTRLSLPMQGRGYSTHSVCLCVCYHSSGRYAHSTGPTKVPKESARHKNQNKHRNIAKVMTLGTVKILVGAFGTVSTPSSHNHF